MSVTTIHLNAPGYFATYCGRRIMSCTITRAWAPGDRYPDVISCGECRTLSLALRTAAATSKLEGALTTRVRYSCPLCNVVKAEVDVPARGAEDVITWTEKVMIIALAQDHARRSPTCRPRKLVDIMIPLTGTDRVGGPVGQ